MKQSDFQGNTPLHLAAEAGKTAVVKFLVERWPEGIRATNRDRETPLHLAAEVGNTDVVRFLVECWPEGKKALNIYGKTPLSKVEKESWRRRKRLSDEEKKEMIALLL
jgi:ankyrin repeat protein